MSRHLAILLCIVAVLSMAWIWWDDKRLTAERSAEQQSTLLTPPAAATGSAAIAKQSNSGSNLLAQPQPQQQSAPQSTDREKAQDTDVAVANHCDELMGFSELADFSFIQTWMDNHFHTQELVNSHYDQLDQQQLLAEAHAGDVLAMRTLARNYKWYATHQKYSRPDGDMSSVLDREALGQARYWLEQAALAGYLGAFDNMSMTYLPEIYHLEEQLRNDTANKAAIEAAVADLHILMHANIALGLKVVPMFGELAPHLEAYLHNAERTAEQQQQFEYSFNALYQRWQTQRTERGLPVRIEFDIPVEVLQWVGHNKAYINCITNANSRN